METIGPAVRRNATGPLRRLGWVKEVPRPAGRGRFSPYAVPLGLLALTGFGLLAAAYLADNRHLAPAVPGLLAAGSVLPVAVAYRLPVLGWRLAFPMLFLGVFHASAREPWPWNTVQIFGFVFVLGRLAAVEGSAVTLWATTLSLFPIFLFAPRTNAWGAALLLVAVAALGDILYRRRRTRQLLAEREELTAAERAKRAVLEERTRIAREMHDVVAHHMSMIAVRAETAPYRVGDLPEPARQELATIASAAREALTDMRRLLGVLRAEQADAQLTPQPGLAEVAVLVRTARAAGVDVTLRLGDPSAVPETVGLTAYRIVQEALANAARHAPDRPVTVDGRVHADRIELTVRNPAAGPVGSGGHGLVGMRERAALLGGDLTAGPDGDAFLVTATLPFGGGENA
jgi:signal transduction histidine kinase